MATFVFILMIIYFIAKIIFTVRKTYQIGETADKVIKSIDLNLETYKGIKLVIIKKEDEDNIRMSLISPDGQTITLPCDD